MSGCGNAAQLGCVTVMTGAGAIGVVAVGALEVRTSLPLETSPIGAALLEVSALETAGVSGVSVTDCVVFALHAVTQSKAKRRKERRIRPAF